MTTSIITNRKRKLPQMNVSHFETAKQRRQKFSSFSQNFRHWFRDSFRTLKLDGEGETCQICSCQGENQNKYMTMLCHVFRPLSLIVIFVHFWVFLYIKFVWFLIGCRTLFRRSLSCFSHYLSSAKSPLEHSATCLRSAVFCRQAH